MLKYVKKPQKHKSRTIHRTHLTEMPKKKQNQLDDSKRIKMTKRENSKYEYVFMDVRGKNTDTMR